MPPVLQTHFKRESQHLPPFAGLWQYAATTTHEESIFAIQASLLVMTHSLLDDVTKRLVSFSMETDLRPWVSRVVSKDQGKFSLGDVLSKEKQSMISEASKRYQTYTERLSLPKRISLLNEIFRPGTSFIGETLNVLTDSDVKELDETRHGIVHGELLGKPFPRFKLFCANTEDTILFLSLACARFHQIDLSDNSILAMHRQMQELVRQNIARTRVPSA